MANNQIGDYPERLTPNVGDKILMEDENNVGEYYRVPQRILSSGGIASRLILHAHVGSSTTIPGGGTNLTVLFDTEVVDANNEYNPATGEFTAAIDKEVTIDAHFRVDGGLPVDTRVFGQILHDRGGTITAFDTDNQSAAGTGAGGATVALHKRVQLLAGDKIWITAAQHDSSLKTLSGSDANTWIQIVEHSSSVPDQRTFVHATETDGSTTLTASGGATGLTFPEVVDRLGDYDPVTGEVTIRRDGDYFCIGSIRVTTLGTGQFLSCYLQKWNGTSWDIIVNEGENGSAYPDRSPDLSIILPFVSGDRIRLAGNLGSGSNKTLLNSEGNNYFIVRELPGSPTEYSAAEASWTPTHTWSGQSTTDFARKSREGDELILRGKLSITATPGTSILEIDIPDSLQVDTAKMAVGFSAGHTPGLAHLRTSGGTSYQLGVLVFSATVIRLTRVFSSGNGLAINSFTATNLVTIDNGDVVSFEVRMPILGWSKHDGAYSFPS